MSSTLFVKELRSNLFVTSIIALVVVMYVATIVSMFDPELGESLDMMMASMPELFAAFGMSTQATTLLGFLLNYLYGFLLTMFPFVLVLILANKLMVRYLDRGTMAYLLSTPTSRTGIACTLIAAFVTILALLMVVTTVSEIGCSELLFPGDLDIGALLRVNVGLFGFWLFLSGLCFLSACFFSSAGKALWVGGGLCIAFFLMQMIAQVGDKFEFLNNINPVMLFDYYGLAASEASAFAGTGALYALGIVLFVASVVVFNRRNLSI